MSTDPTLRFSSRVENYVKYRPSYPSGVIDVLTTQCELTENSVVADIGSGTGILSELFLKHGNRVFGVEPNREMREAGERHLKKYPMFTSTEGTAEATTLPDSSIDFVTAGQAFHWFDPARTRTEFTRILNPKGWITLIWNDRQTETTSFLREYEELLQTYGTDHPPAVNDEEAIVAFFSPQPFAVKQFENRQLFDFDELKGRLLSSSYTPEPGNPNYDPMLAALRAIFNRRHVNSRVSFDYATRMYYGHLT
jgi:SAM-dependent methyltransferase